MKFHSLFCYFLFCFIQTFSISAEPAAVLEASVTLEPGYVSRDEGNTLQPGMPAVIKAVVKNTGGKNSPEGNVYVRFKLPKQLAKQGQGLLFETEKQPLSILEPGKEAEIAFQHPQQMPCLIDFLKNDWSMHVYEVVARINSQEFVIGSRTITFSAHYYLGPGKPLPALVH